MKKLIFAFLFLSTLTVAAGRISNSEISDTAAIAFSKLAALTASRVACTNSSGVVVPCTMPSSYLDASSSIQTQLNAKQASLGYTPLNAASNLSDVGSSTTVRTNLGLGSAASQNLAAFLQPSNNLSDLGNIATAKTNLGFGTAANYASTFFLVAGGSAGGQTVTGGIGAGESLVLISTPNATKGKISFGSSGNSVYDEPNNNLILGSSAQVGSTRLAIKSTNSTTSGLGLYPFSGSEYWTFTASGTSLYLIDPNSNRGIFNALNTGQIAFGLGNANGAANLDNFLVKNANGVGATSTTFSVAKSSSQTGDLQDWRDTDGIANLARVTTTGLGLFAGLTSSAHYKSLQVATTTATVNANAGTGATCSVANATDVAGKISLTTTAIGGASGVECDIGFAGSGANAYGVAPICQLQATNANAILDAVIQGVYLTAGQSTLSINFANADLTGRAYTWNYSCIETQ